MTDRITKPTSGKTALKRALTKLTRDFVSDLFDILDEHGIFDAAERGTPRRVRRDAKLLANIRDAAKVAVEKSPLALSIGDIAKFTGFSVQELAHPLSQLVVTGEVVRTGSRRGTRYRPKGRRAAPKKKPKRSSRR